ncbi:S49 family peptidase [Aestuariivirga sp.]|uniref:S49 family peptidase n=1 Tax=Aestuariivirga sp. TaxID=2650926 RepID=UPI0039E2B294
MPSLIARYLPERFAKTAPVVTHVRLQGAIGMGSPLRPGLNFKDVEPLLQRAFSRKGIAAVALSINSPGGSAVQSALIAARIRQLADKHSVPVLVFCEDVAASGGYWLACAGDEIFADESSIVGSIGVIAASFGFVDALSKLGIERRVHTAGENKAILDPFQPEKEEDVERLLAIQGDVHQAFKALVRSRRAGKLKGDEAELFSGAFWAGREALARGLIDGIGHLHEVLASRFGPKLVLKPVTHSSGWALKRLGFAASAGEGLVDALETRALFRRFGL